LDYARFIFVTLVSAYKGRRNMEQREKRKKKKDKGRTKENKQNLS